MNDTPANTPFSHGIDLPAGTAGGDVDTVYDALVRGVGREHVTDANVDALIERAARDGRDALELLLREWRSPCGDDPDAPVLPPQVPQR